MNLPFHALLGDSATLVVLQATAIMGIALLIGSTFPNWAAFRSCIYTAALVCTFIGPVVAILCSLTGYTVALPFLKPIELSGTTLHVHPPSGETFALDEAERVSTANTTAAATGEVQSSRLPVRTWLLICWSCGSLFSGFGIAMSMARIRRLLGTLKPIDPNTYCSATQRAADNLGVAEFPRIAISDRVHSPVAVGLPGNAWVLLPENCLDAMSQDQLAQVLTHEGAHVIRRDPLIRLLQRIHLALWWWNPLAHLVNGQVSQAREEVCDNVVLERTDGDVYGTTLLELGKLISADTRLVGSVGLFGSGWSLERRIKGILDPGRRRMIQVNRTVFALVFTAFVGATMLTSVTRIDAQEPRERSAERRVKMQRFAHLAAAHKYLKYGSENEELANMVGRHAREIANSLDIDYDQVLRQFREQGFESINQDARQQLVINQDDEDRDLVRKLGPERLRDLAKRAKLGDREADALLQLAESVNFDQRRMEQLVFRADLRKLASLDEEASERRPDRDVEDHRDRARKVSHEQLRKFAREADLNDRETDALFQLAESVDFDLHRVEDLVERLAKRDKRSDIEISAARKLFSRAEDSEHRRKGDRRIDDDE